jgi:L-2,4-diaminobutyrate decarboxylase
MSADLDFSPDPSLLLRGVELLRHYSYLPAPPPNKNTVQIGEIGLGSAGALTTAAELVLGRSQRLDQSTAFAHMDPPTPLVSWIGQLWNARLNQNLLHAATSPAAQLVEDQVVEWLAPWFGMDGGHFTSGSTLANLSALWAARELAGVSEVIASEGAHVSVRKAAQLLGLAYRTAPSSIAGQLDPASLPEDLSRAVLVLTAGATSTGAIDPLGLAGRSAWTHVDAAWAGPLRLTETYGGLLEGVQGADSVAISAHKLLFQPKGSAVILFRHAAAAHEALSFGAEYLTSRNLGVQGSRPAAAVPLYLTLLAWGRQGLVSRINACMAAAETFADWIAAERRLELFMRPITGVILWRSNREPTTELHHRLPVGLASTTTVGRDAWIRNVAANPAVDIEAVIAAVQQALH